MSNGWKDRSFLSLYKRHTLYANALGYFKGRNSGFQECDEYQDFNDDEIRDFNNGYECGVGDFCRFDLCE